MRSKYGEKVESPANILWFSSGLPTDKSYTALVKLKLRTSYKNSQPREFIASKIEIRPPHVRKVGKKDFCWHGVCTSILR